jgi:hypothetical protein
MYAYATPAIQGRAYVVRQSFTGGSFWNCDATSGEPTCYEVNKQVAAAPPANK